MGIRFERAWTLVAVACLLMTAGYAEDDRRVRRQRETLEELSERLDRRLDYPDPTTHQQWLHAQAAAVLSRLDESQEDPYRFDRLARATDALLEASQRLLQAREDDHHDDDEREDTARSLQNDYFRVQQAEYFARLSEEGNAGEYVEMARALYQKARRAYDRRQYRRAETLGDAAGYVAQALEALAQAAIRHADPPRIP